MFTLVFAGLLTESVHAQKSESAAQAEVSPKATVYAFFATWCVPCRVELPHLERLHQEYKDKGLRLVLVSEDAPSTAQSVPPFLARYNVSAEWVLDSESELLTRYNSSGSIPYTVVLDSEGGVAWAHAGYEPGDELQLESEIERLVEQEEPVVSKSKLEWKLTSQTLGVWRESRFQLDDKRKRAGAERLEVAAFAPSLSASVRVDGDLIEEESTDTDLRVERAQLKYEYGAAEATLGDDYVQFGHGMSLSLRKIDSLGLDTTLRGAGVDLSTDLALVHAIAGVTNRQNLDTIDLQVKDEENDVIAGLEVEVPISKDSTISPYVLVVDADNAASDGSDLQWLLGGASTSLSLGKLVIAGEGAGGTLDGQSADGQRETIWAGYLSAQVGVGDISLLADAKAYKDWAIGRTRTERSILYHEAPTLERSDQEVPANDNSLGARARVEWRVPGNATVFGNMLGYRFSQDGSDAIDGDLALHGYLGGDIRFGDTSMGLQAGYRDENKSDGSDKLSLFHVDVDVATSLSPKIAATFKWNHREETKVLFNELKFRRGLAVAGLSWSGFATASLLYGYSTEQATTPTNYPAAEFLFHLQKGGLVRLFAGRLVGGRICVSGSCRDVPPFEGVRLDLVYSY